MKLTIGQTLFVVPINDAARIHKSTLIIHESKIISVGNKFFKLEGYQLRFHISTLMQCAGQFHPQYKCYLSKQDILDEQERKEGIKKIKGIFSGFSNQIPLSLSQIRDIVKIIDINQK